MFEAAELGHTLSAVRYDAELPRLRTRLLDAHFNLRGRKFPVIVIVSGADGAGKGELVQRLNEWLDPRGVATYAFWEQSDEERERPEFWRFWRAMPGRGRIGIFFGSWYTRPIVQRVYGETKRSGLDTSLEQIAALEKTLADDGCLFVKLWLHLPKARQKKRLHQLEKDGLIAPGDWEHFRHFDKFAAVSERAIRHTDRAYAPWYIIEATDRRYREFTAATILLEALESRLAATTPSTPVVLPVPVTSARAKPTRQADSILAQVDLSRQLPDARYVRELAHLQSKLSQLTWTAHRESVSLVLVFEGWDAAGKGSAIRRVTQGIDARLYSVVGSAAPTDEERAQHYLWRFWRHIPRAGFATIFDRSWYGRVLVERIEGFASPAEWSRSYNEINDFEEQLVEHGVVLCKFWLHIDPKEQLRRFREREKIDYKRYKITDEDWRNRRQWAAYQVAVDEMIARCSTGTAPWTVVAGNDKKFARIHILKTIVKRLGKVL